ncbi:MAG TPA: TetR/AcrR family transcriptional regulator [Candidatus Agrococcus pullicola]|uniref:TetR/AcrR family transcriptional regulator n=1 Tax=Candidatus Agrococcus pullicola TaxID=2838429 RepID=A0A9D2C9S7_9MICO|nr:TetR/AcrR family transcriptional regulator [Candidatus Agrococcus pullicola]
MPAKRTGSGQPSKTLALLWGMTPQSAPRKGPARSLTVEQIVQAALELADDLGIDAVTMRAVANRVGVSAMSIYTYIPGKPELLDLMVDTLYAGLPRASWGNDSWRDRAQQVAESNRELLRQHPWMTEIAALSRPPLGPGVMAKYEHELAVFDTTDLSDTDIDAALSYLLGFVQSHCRSARDAERATTDSAMTDAQWWETNQSLLAEAVDPEKFPRAVRIGAAAGAEQDSAWNPDRAWRFGLDRTLDGLAALIDALPER